MYISYRSIINSVVVVECIPIYHTYMSEDMAWYDDFELVKVNQLHIDR